MTASPIHIVLAFDDKFWAPAYALMRSVCLFTYRRPDLHFHLIPDGLSAEHRQALEAITTEFGAHLHFYDVSENADFRRIVAGARRSWQFPSIVYARIILSRILPADIDRVLYLDCDMLVRVPIERLFEIDMQGYPLAAVPDYVGVQIITRRSVIDPRGIFDAAMRYFNSGLLLIDVKAWRQIDVTAKFEAAIANGLLAKIYYDQDFLNLTFKDNWLELDNFWNLLDPKPTHEVLNPHILHFTGKKKPWLHKSRVAFARLYRHVMTNDVYYRYMVERSPAWRRPLIRFIERMNRRTGAPGR